jgi:serine/threonine protein kinase
VKITLAKYAPEEEWVILTNWMMSLGNYEPIEVDMIVIGQHGIFVIEVKHWKWSKVDEKDDRQLLSDINLLQGKTKKIASRLRAPESPALAGYVTGIFLLTDEKNPRSAGELIHGARFVVSTEDDVRRLLISDQPIEYSPQIVRDYGRWMQPSNVLAPDAVPKQINDIRLRRKLADKDGSMHRVFEGVNLRMGTRVHLHLIDMTAGSSPRVARAAREMEALSKLHEHGRWVPQIIDSYQDVDGYINEMKMYSLADPDAPNLAKRVKDDEWSRELRLKFAASALQGLLDLHTADLTEQFVHRNISPQTLLVRHDDRALFTGFDIARVSGAETISAGIAPKSPSEPWIAPEIVQAGYSAATQRSDVFALCRTLQSAFPNDDDVQLVLERGVTADPMQRALLKDIHRALDQIAEPKQKNVPEVRAKAPAAEYWSEGTIVEFHGHRYRVVNRLGAGSMGMTFRVVHITGDDQDGPTSVGKAAKNSGDGDRLTQSYALARAVSDPALARLHEFVAPEKIALDSFIALMEFVPGEGMNEYRGVVQAISDETGLSFEVQVRKWLDALLGALAALHRSGCVHGDVSAANVIVNERDAYSVRLTDFDLVTKIGARLASPGSPRYAAPEAQKDSPALASHDVYALAAMLFDVCFERSPFENGKEGGIIWKNDERARLGALAEFFDRATSSDLEKRFADADEAMHWLDHGDEDLPARESDVASNSKFEAFKTQMSLFVAPNAPPSSFGAQRVPWLRDMLSTYPASLVGNAETRGLESRFARETYVETKLDSHVFEELRDGKAQLVVLCGNAGDGKTAFLQQLAAALGLPGVQSKQRIWEHTLSDGRRMLLNLDGAAAWNEHSADELMNRILLPFMDGRSHPDLLHLVAVNNGRLLEWIEGVDDSPLTRHLRSVLLDDAPEENVQFAHVRYIDLNERSLVGSAKEASADAAPSFISDLVLRMIGGEEREKIWAPCGRCTAQHRCTARHSAQKLRDDVSREQIVRQISRALQAVHQRGRVHITTRELRGALTYIFFGVRYCDDVHREADAPMTPYWDRTFAFDSERRQGEVLTELVALDPALDSDPILDRELLRAMRRDRIATSLASLRRRAFFEGVDSVVEPQEGLRRVVPLFGGAHYEEFARIKNMDDEEKRDLCRRLCAGIAQLETLPGVVLSRLDKGMVPLKILPRTPIESVFWVEKRLDRFSLREERPRTSEPIDWLPNRVALEYEYEDGRRETLWMSSALFSLLLDVADGMRLMGETSRDAFANLSIFTQRLAEEQAAELFAWEPTKDRALHRIWIDRSEVSHGGRQLLRLEELPHG